MGTFFVIKSLFTHERTEDRARVAAFLRANAGARLYLYEEQRGALKIIRYVRAKGTDRGELIDGPVQDQITIHTYNEILRKPAELRTDLALLLGPLPSPYGKPEGIGR